MGQILHSPQPPAQPDPLPISAPSRTDPCFLLLLARPSACLPTPWLGPQADRFYVSWALICSHQILSLPPTQICTPVDYLSTWTHRATSNPDSSKGGHVSVWKWES